MYKYVLACALAVSCGAAHAVETYVPTLISKLGDTRCFLSNDGRVAFRDTSGGGNIWSSGGALVTLDTQGAASFWITGFDDGGWLHGGLRTTFNGSQGYVVCWDRQGQIVASRYSPNASAGSRPNADGKTIFTGWYIGFSGADGLRRYLLSRDKSSATPLCDYYVQLNNPFGNRFLEPQQIGDSGPPIGFSSDEILGSNGWQFSASRFFTSSGINDVQTILTLPAGISTWGNSYALSPQDFGGAIYQNGAWRTFAFHDGAVYTPHVWPCAINSRKDVVGGPVWYESGLDYVRDPILYPASDFSNPIQLKNYVNMAGLNTELATANDINDVGQILCRAQSPFSTFSDLVLLTPSSLKSIRGTLDLGAVSPSWAAAKTFEWQLRQGTNVQASGTFSCAADLSFTITTQASGSYDLYIKGSPFMTRKVTAVTVGSSGLNVPLLNGDIDGDDSVSIIDYLALSEAFEKTSSDPDWAVVGASGTRPRDADLDGDASVSILDYLILSGNYELTGDV